MILMKQTSVKGVPSSTYLVGRIEQVLDLWPSDGQCCGFNSHLGAIFA